MRRTISLFLALMLCLAAVAQASPTITVGEYDLFLNTAGQTIVLYVSDIVPNAGDTAAPGNVNGMVLSVAINEGGVAYGGTPGPIITSIDVDSGPSIWVAPNSPAGHNAPATFNDGQLALIAFTTVSGFVNVSDGILATLVIDTTGFGPGIHKLTLTGGVIADNLGDTELSGNLPDGTEILYNSSFFGETAGEIFLDPEPSSVVLGLSAIVGFGVVVLRKRRSRRA